MTRLLMLTPRPPYPAHSGGALRAYGILRGLRESGFSVTLLCFTDEQDSLKSTPLPDLCEAIVTVAPPHRSKFQRLQHLLFSSQPDLVQRMYSPQMVDALRLLCANDFDIIQFEGLEMATYLPIAAQTGTRAKLIYDAFNAEYALQQNIAAVDAAERRLVQAVYSNIQAYRIHRLEAWLSAHADGYIVVSQEDAALLAPLRGSRPLPIVPSGIFVNDYQQETPLDLGPHALVFTGKMDYRPNIDAMRWFHSDIYPRIRQEVADARLIIVGQQPGAELTRLSTGGDVVVTGAVPTITPYLLGACVYVAPLRMGSGTRLKLLEAMACGCAIVATSTAASGLSERARASMRIVDSAEDFARQVTMLIHDRDQRTNLGSLARARVRAEYDWSAIVPELLRCYAQLGLRIEES